MPAHTHAHTGRQTGAHSRRQAHSFNVQMAHFKSSNWKLNWNFYDRHQGAQLSSAHQLSTMAKGVHACVCVGECIVSAHLTDSSATIHTHPPPTPPFAHSVLLMHVNICEISLRPRSRSHSRSLSRLNELNVDVC